MRNALKKGRKINARGGAADMARRGGIGYI
jgi:hypothetical protein